MKYGIISDIHANLEALDVVLEQLDKHNVDKIICAGDVIGYGANPNECANIVRNLGIEIVGGNHDYALVGKLSEEFFNMYARISLWWTKQNLDKENLEFLKNLELVKQINSKITLVHSSLYRPEAFEYVLLAYDAHLSFELQTTPITIIGHSHIPVTFIRLRKTVYYDFTREIIITDQNKYLINVGSVGQPRDENPNAAFCIYDTDEGIARIIRVKYNVAKAAQKIKKAGLPEILAERLKVGA